MPKRLYQYGTLGLSVYDDRTDIEKFCDKVDDLIENLEQKYRVRKRDNSIFHTFFDISSRMWISSVSDIKKIERERGWKYMHFDEIEREADKNYKETQRKSTENHKKYFESAFRDLKQGRSFKKELHEKIRKGEYEIGKRSAFNQN